MKAYNKKNIPLAKNLRKNMTPWERKLWYEYLQYYPLRFQRQKAVGEYIVDFYCAKARLVIELDGGGHYEVIQTQKDTLRTENLEQMNLRVVRICNQDIDNNFRGVCEYIDMAVQGSLPQSAALTAPSSEGAFLSKETHMDKTKKIIALGFFDGVHLGHQALLRRCVQMARETGAIAAAITFENHPQTLFSASVPGLLSTAADRERLLRGYGMEKVYIYPVTEKVMSTNWQAFLEQLTDDGAAGFVCGNDFRFGHRGEGSAEKLREFCAARGLPCAIVSEQLLDGVRISSTHIRSLMEAGQMAEAVRFLGHPHILTGKVVSGRELGRTIGIPTANLFLPGELLKPAFGVYACRAAVEGQNYLAVTNVGVRPTVSGDGITVESWLLDFAGDLYGKEMTLEFHTFLRPEKKFADLAALGAEIRENGAQVRKFFEKK